MQKVIDPTFLFKAILPLVVLLGIDLGMQVPAPEINVTAIVQVVILVAGMIAIAAVMRHDVSALNKWKEKHEEDNDGWQQKHEETHDRIVEILAELKEAKKQVERRISILERRKEDRE